MEFLIPMWRGMFWGAVLLAHLTLTLLCGTLVFKTLAQTKFFEAAMHVREIASAEKSVQDYKLDAQAAAEALGKGHTLEDARTILWKVTIWGLLFSMTLGFFFLTWEWWAVAKGRTTRYLFSLAVAGGSCFAMGVFAHSLLASLPGDRRPLPVEPGELWQFAGEPVALATHPFFIFAFLVVPACVALARKRGLLPGG